MGRADLRIDPAGEDERSYVESLLAQAGLPTRDVRSKPDCFYVGSHDDQRVGVGGLEVYGSAGLLRSIVVEESRRDSGFGTAICDELEREARSADVETLYLLTTTAADFFADRGFDETPRSDAPAAIRETAQFADLCPDDAVCMAKSL